MYPAISAVKPLPQFRLLLTFDNKEQRILDFSEYLDTGIFSELKDESKFKTVHVSFDSIEWENGADLDPELIYETSESVDGKVSI
jgi:hypothetical protein